MACTEIPPGKKTEKGTLKQVWDLLLQKRSQIVTFPAQKDQIGTGPHCTKSRLQNNFLTKNLRFHTKNICTFFEHSIDKILL